MRDTPENACAANAILREKGNMPCQKYAINVDFSQMNGNQLFIVALAADRSFQEMDADTFFNYLSPSMSVNPKLKEKEIHIYLLVSDVNPETDLSYFFRRNSKNLSKFSRELLDVFVKNDYNVTLSVCSDINYSTTILVAPEHPADSWRVFALERDTVNCLNYEEYCAHFTGKNIDPLWKGLNICEWLGDAEKLITKNDNSWDLD